MYSPPKTNLEGLRARVMEAYAAQPRRIGRYQIRGELGRGGMGVVYDAFDPTLRRAVAIKIIRGDILDPRRQQDFAARFEREMCATSEIFHPNVVAMLDAGTLEDGGESHAYCVMERIEGESLEERLRRTGPLARDEAIELALGIARGLAAAHESGLIHRDLKPANILVSAAGEPKIADFGLCRLLLEKDEGTRAAEIVGSANYIAPEQIKSETVGETADLFSFGAILVKMLTGREPFAAATLYAHLRRVQCDAPDHLERIDPALRALVAQLLEKRPGDRPRSAAEVVARLEALSGEAAARRRARTRRWVVAGATVMLLLGFVTARAKLHNELVALDAHAETQLREVHNQLDRQRDLIPKLAQLAGPSIDAEGSADIGGVLLDELSELFASDPALRSDRHSAALYYELVGSRNRLTVERTRYNDAVRRLNQQLDQLPWRWFRGEIEPRAYFEMSNTQRAQSSSGATG